MSQQQAPHKPGGTWAEKLKSVLTEEQLEQMAEILLMTYDLAITRKADQLFQIPFNDKGIPLGFNGSNWVRAVKPNAYKAE